MTAKEKIINNKEKDKNQPLDLESSRYHHEECQKVSDGMIP